MINEEVSFVAKLGHTTTTQAAMHIFTLDTIHRFLMTNPNLME